ncbi:hypothetical protein HK099_002240 [Clydaea vesicula]|uniref:Xylose isomerase n=1 Tax=Clydaea vesicula TaxID=447962 RepID=A0AAD5TVF3_9FUNG|nr:hypothetical protein HK099_002240 [Clydaea vesicula]
MEVTKKLNGASYVFWGGREGYQSILNTDLKTELDNFASFLKMAVAHKKQIGADFQLLIEPKPKEPTKHQYDYDAQTVMGFLLKYDLDKEFNLNIEPNHTTLAGHSYEHDLAITAAFGKLGSIDCNTGDESLGWDTDEKKATFVMKLVIKMGGLGQGGLNFDCKVRRESTDLEDLFIAHVGAMDVFAKGLRNAAVSINGKLSKMLTERYESWESKEGKEVRSGKSSFEQLEKFIKASPQIPVLSGKQELFDRVFNDEIHDALRN